MFKLIWWFLTGDERFDDWYFSCELDEASDGR
jgi:hypothetical protein